MSYSTLFKLAINDLKTEAQVETRLLTKIFNDLGYPQNAIIPKERLSPLIVHDGTKRTKISVDFLLKGSDGHARLIVEAKDPKYSVQKAWGQTASYALSYNRDKNDEEKIQWLLISNGHITSLFRHDSVVPIVTLQLSDFASGSPPYSTLRSYIKYKTAVDIPSGALQFEIVPPEKLNQIFSQCHDLVHKKEIMNPTDAFFEFCKFIFLKIREDKKREGQPSNVLAYKLPMTLDWLSAQEGTSKHPVRDLFITLRNDLEAEIVKNKKKRIYEQNETLKLSASTCKELIKRFQTINLSSIDEDLNGRMFEVFLNAAIRGRALGQYFTPRPVVDFMTRIGLQGKDVANPPKVIDACSGTAGFLIEVMAYLLSSLRDEKRFTDTEQKTIRKKICNEMLFGIEGNERVARIARINMYLHGDGGTHIFFGNGLDNEPMITDDMPDERKDEVVDHVEKIKPESFDLVLTNPPFSMVLSNTNEDEERILSQRSFSQGRNSVKSNILFLIRYYELLKPGGDILIILDDTILNGGSIIYTEVRQWITKNFIILGIHSLPFNAFFKAKANIKTSILHLRKRQNDIEKQGYVFMSIGNNIGHDNSLKDTPERNNLTDILVTYLEWRRTGNFAEIIKPNHDLKENLECSEQVWLVAPEELSEERLDAFFYSPELKNTWKDLKEMEKNGAISLMNGKAFKLRPKLSKESKRDLISSKEELKYIEIGDVTRYGLILTYITNTFDKLPSRGEYQVKKGDILLAINNSSRGTVVLVPEKFDGAICTSGFLVIVPQTEMERYLLWYALRSEYCRAQIYYLAQTASQPELKLGAWRKHFQVPMPIGSIAEKAFEDAKEFNHHMNKLLDADDYRLKEYL